MAIKWRPLFLRTLTVGVMTSECKKQTVASLYSSKTDYAICSGITSLFLPDRLCYMQWDNLISLYSSQTDYAICSGITWSLYSSQTDYAICSGINWQATFGKAYLNNFEPILRSPQVSLANTEQLILDDGLLMEAGWYSQSMSIYCFLVLLFIILPKMVPVVISAFDWPWTRFIYARNTILPLFHWHLLEILFPWVSPSLKCMLDHKLNHKSASSPHWLQVSEWTSSGHSQNWNDQWKWKYTGPVRAESFLDQSFVALVLFLSS